MKNIIKQDTQVLLLVISLFLLTGLLVKMIMIAYKNTPNINREEKSCQIGDKQSIIEETKNIIRDSIIKQGDPDGVKILYYDESFKLETYGKSKEKESIVLHFFYEIWLSVNGRLYPINGSTNVMLSIENDNKRGLV